MAAKTIRVETLRHGYRRSMPFNRYFIEKIDGFVVMHFGLLAPSGNLLDCYSCAISLVELENQKKSLMDYLGKIGALGEAPAMWQPPAGLKHVDLCNHIGLCGNSAIGEITLNNMVGREISEMKPNQTTVQADTISLLRSSLEIQKHWLKDLFK